MSQRPVNNESELIELIRSIDEPAPERLHRRTEALIARHARSGGDTRAMRLRLGAVGALSSVAVLVAVLVLSAGPGGSASFTLQSATALTLRAATAAAPHESAIRRAQLTAAVDNIPFPYWGERFGWRATGTRTDHVDGHAITTIFYAGGRGRRIGYAIVAGGSPPRMSGGVVLRRDGTPYRLLTQKGAPVVTWLRHGHLCIVSGRGVSGATLLRLASWDDRGTVS